MMIMEVNDDNGSKYNVCLSKIGMVSLMLIWLLSESPLTLYRQIILLVSPILLQLVICIHFLFLINTKLMI